jgi:hypothetical protein
VLAIGSDIRLQRVLNILTPASVLSTGEYGTLMSGSVLLGLVLQLMTIGVLVHAITVRLRLSAAITTATAH